MGTFVYLFSMSFRLNMSCMLKLVCLSQKNFTFDVKKIANSKLIHRNRINNNTKFSDSN